MTILLFKRFVSCGFLLSAVMLFAAEADYAKDAASTQMSAADVLFLTDGVDGIGQSGVPGPLCVFGRNAAAVIAGKEGNTSGPLVAAAKYKDGRVVAFGHDGYLSKTALSQFGGQTLLKNILRWLAQNKNDVRIAVIGNPAFAEYIKELGYSVQPVNRLTDIKDNAQIIVLDGSRITEQQVSELEKFITNGGGVLTASLGWGWLQVSGKTDLQTEHGGNLLLAPLGIVWADGSFTAPAQKDGKNFFPVSKPETLQYLNVSTAVQVLQDSEKKNSPLPKNDAAQITATLVRGIQSIPETQSEIFVPLRPLTQRTVVPSPENKIKWETMPLDALAVSLQTEQYLKKQDGTGKHKIPAANPLLAAAESFPGAVPKDAKTLNKTFQIDTSVPDWRSLGLYAPPGQTITVKIPKELITPRNRRYLGVRIGCHSDTIWHLNEWDRYPEITLTVPLQTEETKIVNPFGGLVYITVPRNYDKRTIFVEVSGAVESPYFVLGKTSVEEWKENIRDTPAPWGELASDKLVLSVPSRYLRTLDDPDKVMEFWNEVLDWDADLCGQPKERVRPERITCDRQISAGYMHSGYPVMTWMDVEPYFLSLKDNPNKGWGFFHEFGHNHQASDWTFDGTGEVTVNLFALYVFEKIFNLKPAQAQEKALGSGHSPTARKAKREKYFADGSPFEKWKSDPFLALIMYTDLQEKFGWEPFKNVFREYRQLKPEERPKTDDDKRGQWLMRMSQEVKHNLSGYFDRWGVPVPQWAKDAVKDLPEWNPY
ncbi:MAG: M60 family metallopeptidase [Planctomycetaceae bacterium]|jgi:hypothetical protein|nr:M60 family metallopeptidase [Planctomycetaceae bacterium]